MIKLTVKYHTKPVPLWALSLVVSLGIDPKELWNDYHQGELISATDTHIRLFKYKRRNAMQRLVAHRIDRTDDSITVYTMQGRPCVTFQIEKVANK